MIKKGTHHLSWLSVLLIMIVSVISACDSSSPNVQVAAAGQASNCLPAFLSFAENYIWPSGGHELILRAEDQEGKPWAGTSDCLSITDVQPATALPSQIRSTVLAPGVTLIAVQPDPTVAPSVYRDAIRAFIETRPSDERIALYGWGNNLVQICDFTQQRQRLFSLLDRLQRVITDQDALTSRAVFDQTMEIITRVESPNLRGMRSIVFISGNATSASIPHTQKGIAAKWVLSGQETIAAAQANVLILENTSDLASALVQVSEQMDRDATEAYYQISLCADPTEKTTIQVSAGTGEGVAVELDKSLKGEENGQCDVAQIAAGNRNGVHTIQFFLTDEQLITYQQRLGELEALRAKYAFLPDELCESAMFLEGRLTQWGEVKDDFDLTASLDPSYEPVKATAHLRGLHGLLCDRKSYTVNLSGKEARYFGEQSGSDEFYLIAMCEDPTLFHAYLTYNLYSQYDLFPLRIRYVELLLNGEKQGIYLMMEKRKEELLRDNARLRGIIRRGHEGANKPEVGYTINDEATMLATYRKTMAFGVPKEALPDYLREIMDLDQYLTWMGLNSIVENADTLDECFFISTESIDSAGLATDYFRLMAWDPEDIQIRCQTGKIFRDDYNLTFCQTSFLEQRIINHPVIFEDYVKNLKPLLAEISSERCQSVLDKAQTELFPLLEREGVIEAMQIPNWTNVQSAKNKIVRAMTKVKRRIKARIEVLQEGIKNYEETQQ